MDYTFPPELFPAYFNSGPPSSAFRHNVGGWGSYGQAVKASSISQHEEGPCQSAQRKFVTQHQVEGETWLPVEPFTLPLLQPKAACKLLSTSLSDPLDFSKHMQNFYLHNYRDAFCSMSEIIEESLHCGKSKKSRALSRSNGFMDKLKFKKCELTYTGNKMKAYHNLLGDVIHDIPPELLGDLLHEELTHQRDLEQFPEKATDFHKVVLECHEDRPPCIHPSHKLFSLQLNGTIRQICIGTEQDEPYVGVRSDYMCGVWLVREMGKPKTLEVIQTKEPATCLSISPHIPGELLVASESGGAHLWTVGKGLQIFRKEDSNLYFNARSAWRWCDFSAHPRVMVYADRTGMELTDMRTQTNCSHTLFRISQTPECKSGERVIMSKYLREVHTFHHLITTQYSAYILDERFPCIPMIKWDHMMEDPPVFAHVLANLSEGGTTKVVLGSQQSQELTLLQYSGGRKHACCTRGPPSALLMPKDSLHHLPVQVPHRHQTAQQRLELKAAGVTCIQGKKDICVLQLTEAGDIFYQMLKPQTEPSREEDTVAPVQDSENVPQPASLQTRTSQRLISKTSQGLSKETLMVRERREGTEVSISPGSTGPGFKEHITPVPRFNEGINDDPEEADLGNPEAPLNGQKTYFIPPSTSLSVDTSTAWDVRPSLAKVGNDSVLQWKIWLLRLFKMSRSKRCLPHRIVKAPNLFSLTGDSLWREPTEGDKRQSLRREFREAVKSGIALVHGATHLRPFEPVPVPDPVEPSQWKDDLSQRLSLAWEGGWKDWWEEKLGTNRESKMQALRRKRRKQKMSRAQNRFELSGSFTSSVSYQSDLDNLSGWSSAASQSAASDIDSEGTSFSKLPDYIFEPGTLVTYPSSSQQNSLEDDLTSVTVLRTPVRTPKRLNEDNLSSLFGSQEPSNGAFDEGSFSTPLATSSQVSGISASQRSSRVGASSQLKRKKSRMGF